jgi:hypothetical protein
MRSTEGAGMGREPQEADLLVKFEIENIPAEYRDYYAKKRNNLFARIQGYPALWRLYQQLDEIWIREFADLRSRRETYSMLPLLCCMNCHAKIRVSLELAFSDCLAEARSILRDAIEFLAHAHTMLSDVNLQTTWLDKVNGKQEEEAFKDAFERNKKRGLFNGLEELHKTWGQLSEVGSHANATAMAERFAQIYSGDNVDFRLNYTGTETKVWVLTVFNMLLTCFTMEDTFFVDYNDRLKLDAELLRKRAAFERAKEQLRASVIRQFQLSPPGGIHRVKPTIYGP